MPLGEVQPLKSRVVALLVATIVCVLAVPFVSRHEATVAAAQSLDTETTDAGIEPSAVPNRATSIDFDAARAAGVSLDVLHLALSAIECGVRSGDLAAPPTLTLIDYSMPSTMPRLWVFDLRSGTMLFKELVAHGKGTGDNMAERFSDDMNSHQSSLGLFVTADTYIGNNGYSLRLDGLEPGFNSRARERAIVMHGAAYVSAEFAAKQGRLGRSWGCPALSDAVARHVIDTVRGGGVVFSYYPDPAWLARSRFLHCGAKTDTVVATR